MNKREKILFILLQLFLLTLLLPYNDIVSGVITGALLLSCLLFNTPSQKLALLKSRNYIQWMLFFLIWMGISLFSSAHKSQILPTLDPRLALGYFPLSIGLIRLRKEFREQTMLGFAILTTLVSIACVVKACLDYHRTTNIDFLYNDALTLLTRQQSIYISMFVNISIYVFCYFLFFKKERFKTFLVAAICFLFLFSYLLASRNLMIVLYASALLFGIYYTLVKKQYAKGLGALAVLMVIAVTVFTFFPKTLNRFQDIGYPGFNYQQQGSESHYSNQTTADQWNGANFRLAAWRCGWELFREHPVVGTHLADKQDRVLEKYVQKNFQFALQTRKNLHNNYLDILVSMGLIGIFLFLMGWIFFPVVSVIRDKDYLSLVIILTFAIATITEVYFDRSLGGMLFGFFIPFLLSDKAG